MDDSPDEREHWHGAADDPEVFQALYRRYFKRVYAYVAARIGNPHDAEDVVSEVFLKVLKNLRDMRSRQPASFAAWLFVTARNTVTDYYRRNGHATALVQLDEAAPVAAEEQEPEHVAGQREIAAQLGALVGALPERKREIVTLKYYGGLRNHEIAIVLGIGEKTVAAYLSRALDELQSKSAASQLQDEI